MEKKVFYAATPKPTHSTNISRFTSTNLPAQLKTYSSVQKIPLKCKKALVKSVDLCTRRISMLTLPRDGEGLYE